MRTYDFSNEKRFQKAYGLRYQPDRYNGLEAARIGLAFYTKSHMIVEVDENQLEFKAGYYVVCPSDASRLERAGYRIVSPFN